MRIITTNTSLTIPESAANNFIGAALVLVIGGFASWQWGFAQGEIIIGGGILAVAIAAALASVFFGNTTTTVLDKATNTITVTKANRARGQKTETTPLSSVVSVLLTISYRNTTSRSDNSTSASRTSTISLVLQNGGRMQIGAASGSGATINGIPIGKATQQAPLSQEAQQIANFLSLPLTLQDFSAMASMNQVGQVAQQAVRTGNDTASPQASTPPPAASTTPVQPQPTAQQDTHNYPTTPPAGS